MKNITKISLFVSFVCVAFLIWFTAFSGDAKRAEAQRETTCNVANLRGTYVYAAFGTIAPGNPVGFPAGPYNSAATLVIDGAGNYTVTAKTSYNGVIVDEYFADAYVVDDHCGVTFLYQGLPAVHAKFTVNRSETRGIATIPGTNITYLTVRN